MHKSNLDEQLTQEEKKSFKLLAKEMMFDVKIVKCKWEEENAVMVLLSDISQKVAIDRMRQINQYKNEMLASITHNLKTPLNGVMLMIESALVSNSLEIAQKQLNLAQNSGRLLLYMINDLLDYSRLNSGKHFQLVIQQFRLDDLISNIRSLLINQFEAKNIQLQFIMAVNENHQICFNDQLRIEQVLLNLCLNALKFTFKGYVKIFVFEDKTCDNEIFFTVQDSGLGISEQFKKNLFKFNIFNKNYKEQSKRHGVGLGLSVCYKLVSQLGRGKDIQMETQCGKGTSFTFSVYRKHPKNLNDKFKLSSFKSLKHIKQPNMLAKNIDKSQEQQESPFILPCSETIQLKARRNSLSIRKASIKTERERYICKPGQNITQNEQLESNFESNSLQNSFYLSEIHSSRQSIPMNLQTQIFNIPQRRKLRSIQFERKKSLDLNINAQFNTQQIEDEDNDICSEKKQIIFVPQIQINSQCQAKDYEASNNLTNEHSIFNQSQKINKDHFNVIQKYIMNDKQQEENNPPNFSFQLNLDHNNCSQQISHVDDTNHLSIKAFEFEEKQVQDQINEELQQLGQTKMTNYLCLANQQKNLIERMNQLIWRKTKLLIVDDTIFNVVAIKLLLRNIPNLIIEEAYNGQQAVQKVKENKDFQLIFMDINMPVLDGFQATYQINKLMQQNLIPLTTIIMVSAFNDETDRKKSFQCGAKAHIDKPVSLQSIFDALQILDIAHLQKEKYPIP